MNLVCISLVLLELQFLTNSFLKKRKKKFSALNNVSFDVYKGEVISIISKNGAGKSTLLKILSKITKQHWKN